ncbi:MAG: hypothetical protein V2A73_07510 [Pseudomonadota bacterium]
MSTISTRSRIAASLVVAGSIVASGNGIAEAVCIPADCNDGHDCTKDECKQQWDPETQQYYFSCWNTLLTTVCRPIAGLCDVEEKCTGTSWDCPSDKFKEASDRCRLRTTECDFDDYCTGQSADCVDKVELPSAICRPANGYCDLPERCTGSPAAKECPPDDPGAVQPEGLVCREARPHSCELTAECDGKAKECPANPPAPATTLCRQAAGPCDAAEYCGGSSQECPDDGRQPATFVCRPAADVCDVEERCDGQSAECPQNGFTEEGTVCREEAGVCDVAEVCDGKTAACPLDDKAPDHSDCDDGDACTTEDECIAGICIGSGLCEDAASSADGNRSDGSRGDGARTDGRPNSSGGTDGREDPNGDDGGLAADGNDVEGSCSCHLPRRARPRPTTVCLALLACCALGLATRGRARRGAGR